MHSTPPLTVSSTCGARFLNALGLDDVSPLVAHLSGARVEAAQRGMTDRDRWITDEPDLLEVLTLSRPHHERNGRNQVKGTT